jgi:hypothetical protein
MKKIFLFFLVSVVSLAAESHRSVNFTLIAKKSVGNGCVYQGKAAYTNSQRKSIEREYLISTNGIACKEVSRNVSCNIKEVKKEIDALLEANGECK